ncbi:hypothetical protein HYU19_03110 [Candidatus Woesearchaeota archaeon]|nr:hypothetical protein [Candidatus Woesearchaeota archaeon]
MSQEEIIRRYFKNGVKQGFKKEHLRETLLKHGYDYTSVHFIYNTLGGDASSDMSSGPAPERPSSPFPSSPRPLFPSPSRLFLFALVLIGIVGAFALISFIKAPSPTGMAVQNSQEAALDDIAQLDQEITERHSALQQQLEELKQKDMTIEEKNSIIQQQVAELEKLHASITEERDMMRDLLLDLFNTLVDRPVLARQQAASPQATE